MKPRLLLSVLPLLLLPLLISKAEPFESNFFQISQIDPEEAPRWDVAPGLVGVSKIVTGDENCHDGGLFPAGALVTSILMER